MIRYLFSGNIQMILFSLISSLMVVWFILPLMGYAEAKVADMLGDPTPRNAGCLSLNPLRHIDFIGALCIVLFGFGWGRGVGANPNYFKHRKSGTVLSALAGPLTLLLSAFVLCFLQELIVFIAIQMNTISQVTYGLLTVLQMMISINICIAIFNLLPIPPLSGARILFVFLPSRCLNFYYRYQQFFLIGLLVVVMCGLLDTPISWLSNGILSGFYWVAGLPFGLTN